MKRITATLALAAAMLSPASGAFAATLEDLQKEMEILSAKIKALENAPKPPPAAPAEAAAAPPASGDSYLKKVWDKTKIGGYGELEYMFTRENGSGLGGNVFDPHRFVLYVNSELADWVTLNAELEWEHGGVKDEVKSDGDLSGEVAVEQAFLDFKLARPFNVKTGVMLVPVGAINLYHEPTNFNSSARPQVDQFIIPSTWSEMGVGIHGALGDRADYQLLVMNGLDGSEFSAKKGIRDGRQNLNEDNNRGKAVTGRLELRPCTNLFTNLSFYTGNSAPSGNPSAWTTLAAFDGKYSIGDLDLAGEYAFVYQDKPAALGVEDIGHSMTGWWAEGAYHVFPSAWKSGKLSEADAFLFGRYSQIRTQRGSLVNPDLASGRFDRNYTTFGIAFKPITQAVVKADYTIYDDRRQGGETPLDSDRFQVTFGFVF